MHSIQFEYIGLKMKLLDQLPYIHNLVQHNYVLSLVLCKNSNRFTISEIYQPNLVFILLTFYVVRNPILSLVFFRLCPLDLV